MKILFSIHHLLNPNAGVAGVTFRLASELKALGHEVDLLSMSDMGLSRESVWTHIRYPWFVSQRLMRIGKQYDVLDFSSGDGWLFGKLRPARDTLIVARSHGLEHVVHFERIKAMQRGEIALSRKYRFYHGGFRLWEVAESFRRADLSLFLNQQDRDVAIKSLGVRADRAKVVDNGIADIYIDLPEPSSAQSPGLKIAMIGTYNHRKIHRVPTLLDRLLSSHCDWELGFFGTGVADEVVRRDFSAEIQKRISVARRYDNNELPTLLRKYDVLLFPSLSEGFGVAVFEAMACGLAVVASELPSLAERLENEENVLFVPTGNLGAIESALLRLANNPDLLYRLKKQGHRRAQQYSWKRIAGDTEAAYQEALNMKRGELHGT